MTQGALRRVTASVVTTLGWISGTDLEDHVARLLSSFKLGPEVTAQQLRVGPYRLDFAWPHQKLALEADGWYHRSPEGAGKDAMRDSWLRAQGWVIFRVDDRSGEDALKHQVARVARIVKTEGDGRSPRPLTPPTRRPSRRVLDKPRG